MMYLPSWWLLAEILLERRIRMEGQNGLGWDQLANKARQFGYLPETEQP